MEPKLCKDCKHALWPHPLQQLSGNFYGTPMCSHPDADRSMVTGCLTTTCATARGDLGVMISSSRTICGPQAKLFEQRPPEVPVEPYLVSPYPGVPEPVVKGFLAWLGRLL